MDNVAQILARVPRSTGNSNFRSAFVTSNSVSLTATGGQRVYQLPLLSLKLATYKVYLERELNS